MDDIILIEDDLEEMERLKRKFASKFEIKHLGCLRYFLGMESPETKRGFQCLRENMSWICWKKKNRNDVLQASGHSNQSKTLNLG